MSKPTEVPMTEARPELTALGERVRAAQEHIVVTRAGRPFFVMVPMDWYAKAAQALARGEAGDTAGSEQ